MDSKINRRKFLTHVPSKALWFSVLAAASGASTFGLSACASLDDYIFEDDLYLKKQTPIVGGGISGLYLGQLLRKKGVEFRLFEAANQLGGRIRSAQGVDFGASVFSEANQLLNSLVKEFALSKEAITKDLFSLRDSAESLVVQMSKRIAGLIPSRSLRLKSELIAIKKISSYYEMAFETPQGRKTYVSQKVALSIPPTQWSKVDGLLKLDEMSWAAKWLETLETEQAISLHLKTQARGKGKFLEKVEDGFKYRLVPRVHGGTEANLFFSSSYKMSPEHINSILADTLKLVLFDDESSSIFDWRTAQHIQGAYFRNKQPMPEQKSETFQVFGDYSAKESPHTVEGALFEASRVAEILV